MEKTDINRRIAEKLEPEPKFTDANATISQMGMYRRTLLRDAPVLVRDLEDNLKCMWDLMEATRQHGRYVGIEATGSGYRVLVRTILGDVSAVMETSAYERRIPSERVCEAVRDAVAKALGVES